ncbi:unnamed protein product, partial [Scytosiphon promiscuus]
RGPWNALHNAALDGCTAVAVALLSRGSSAKIDRGDPKGRTPLSLAAGKGHSRIVRILLNKGANPSAVDDNGLTALLVAAHQGHLDVVKMLVQAGEDLEQVDPYGHTPLHIAAANGQGGVVRVLLEAGANPDSRLPDGRTPMLSAAEDGHPDTIRELLRANADPCLGYVDRSGLNCGPLDAAAESGQLASVLLLIQELGIMGCGGASGGQKALQLAAREGKLDILVALTNAGVVDPGAALAIGAAHGRETCVRFLLLRQQKKSGQSINVSIVSYVNNTLGHAGLPPLAQSVISCAPHAPRIMRMLMDAGADAKSALPLVGLNGMFVPIKTPLNLVDIYIAEKRVGRGRAATKEELSTMQAMRRLLLLVDAVHAISWLWHSDIPPTPKATPMARQ